MPHTDRRSSAEGHILIGGTGRAGTTLLVQYFTALGFDTGFTLEETTSRLDPISQAGLERPVAKFLGRGRGMPYVAKSPGFGKNLVDYLESGKLKVKHCIIPMRDLGEAAESRRAVARAAVASGKAPDDLQPGGLVARTRKNAGQAQERILAMRFHNFVLTMLTYDVPIHFLRFPDFAQGRQDLFVALEPILTEHGVTREESDAALAVVLRPNLIHDFSSARVDPNA
jgi:hypothetical protein